MKVYEFSLPKTIQTEFDARRPNKDCKLIVCRNTVQHCVKIVYQKFPRPRHSALKPLTIHMVELNSFFVQVSLKDPKMSGLICCHKNGLERSRVKFESMSSTPGKVSFGNDLCLSYPLGFPRYC